MSVESRQREAARYRKEIADLQKKDSDEVKKEVSKAKEADRVSKSLRTTRSEGTARNYQVKLIRLSDDISKISAKRADVSKKIAVKMTLLHRAEQHLAKEQETERKKIAAAEKRRESEQLSHQKKITDELRLQKQLLTQYEIETTLREKNIKHDVFISHASEDKDSFVRPLARELTNLGFDVWMR